MKQVGYYRAGRRDKKRYPIMIDFVEEGMLILVMDKQYNSVVANFGFSNMVDEELRGDAVFKLTHYSTFSIPKYKQYCGWICEVDFFDEFIRVFSKFMLSKFPSFKLYLFPEILKQQLLLASI